MDTAISEMTALLANLRQAAMAGGAVAVQEMLKGAQASSREGRAFLQGCLEVSSIFVNNDSRIRHALMSELLHYGVEIPIETRIQLGLRIEGGFFLYPANLGRLGDWLSRVRVLSFVAYSKKCVFAVQEPAHGWSQGREKNKRLFLIGDVFCLSSNQNRI